MWMTAHHEAGHAVTALSLGARVLTATIGATGRGGAVNVIDDGLSRADVATVGVAGIVAEIRFMQAVETSGQRAFLYPAIYEYPSTQARGDWKRLAAMGHDITDISEFSGYFDRAAAILHLHHASVWTVADVLVREGVIREGQLLRITGEAA